MSGTTLHQQREPLLERPAKFSWTRDTVEFLTTLLILPICLREFQRIDGLQLLMKCERQFLRKEQLQLESIGIQLSTRKASQNGTMNIGWDWTEITSRRQTWGLFAEDTVLVC